MPALLNKNQCFYLIIIFHLNIYYSILFFSSEPKVPKEIKSATPVKGGISLHSTI